MSILVCGSVAFDNIMVFNDRFRNHILPDQLHILNVSFLVPDMHQQYGGCAGNIAYNLSLLGCEPYVMATVGTDFDDYRKWMDKCGMNREYIKVVDGTYTPRAFIITDMDDNQITAFHPGAMNQCHINKVPIGKGIVLGIISPDGRQGMLQHAQQFKNAGIPFVFDPGQGTPMFTVEELEYFIDQADWIACNDYEARMICERTSSTVEQITERVRAFIITQGEKGSLIYTREKVYTIPVVRPAQTKDPTGCGDAYRA
ncbi:MAG: carbohydrate kinase family protein, partial [Gammaproteobacteria bacterium]|nr:carbohydrate kinase family protein [Gammaproteobacteria bacterium]